MTVTLFDPVWYVKNDYAGPSQGTSENPFQTLAEAETAAGINDKIFVFTGDGSTTGQNAGITLQNGQSLIGEGVDLVLNINGTPSTIVSGSGMLNDAPSIGNTAGIVVDLADDNTVEGMIVLPTAGAGIQGGALTGGKRSQKIVDGAGKTAKRVGGTTLVRRVLIRPASFWQGLQLIDQTGNFTFEDSEITGLPGSIGRGLLVDAGTATMTFDQLNISRVGTGIFVGGLIPNGITFTNTHLSDCSDVAVQIAPGTSTVTFAANSSIQQITGGGGLSLQNHTGTVHFNSPITVSNLAMGKQAITLLSTVGIATTVNFEDVTINATNDQTAIQIENFQAGSTINFNGVLDINSSGLNGLSMINCSGAINVLDTASDIANARGVGVYIFQGAPVFVCNASITNNIEAVRFEGITGGSTNFNGTITHGTSPHPLFVNNGLFLDGSAGTHLFERINVGTPGNPSPDQAIEILNCTGAFTFENFDLIAVRDGLTIFAGNPTVNVLTNGTVGNIHSTQVRGILNFAGSLNGRFTNVTVGSMAAPASGPGIQILGGGGGTIAFEDIDIHVSSTVRPGIEINAHDVSFDSASNINVSTNGIRALILQNGNYSGQIDSVSKTGIDDGIQLLNQTGTLELGLVNINTTGSMAFEAINVDTITVTDPASSLSTSGHSTVVINGATIGAGNMVFNSVINVDSHITRDAIDIDDLSGGTLQIANLNLNNAANGRAGMDVRNSSATVQVDAGTIQVAGNPGINLIDNTGAFNFAGLGMTGTTQPGVNMTGGGTIQFTGTNTVTTTTGTAVNIVDSTMGTSGVTFESINTNGATNGILLNNTGTMGFFAVTGDGSNLSGGTLTNSTGDAISLTDVQDIRLTEMDLNNSTDSHINASNVNGLTLNGVEMSISGFHGIFGNSITALSMTDCLVDQSGDAITESGINITNLLGSSQILSTDFTLSRSQHIFIANNATTQAAPMAPADILTIDNSSFTMPRPIATFNNNINIEITGTGNMRVILDDAIGPNIINDAEVAILVETDGNMAAADIISRGVLADGQTRHGIFLIANNNATMTFDVSGNAVENLVGDAIRVISSGGANSSGQVVGNIVNNSTSGRGINLEASFGGFLDSLARNNQITAAGISGISAGNQGDGGALNLTLDNNTVDNSGISPIAAGIPSGFRWQYCRRYTPAVPQHVRQYQHRHRSNRVRSDHRHLWHSGVQPTGFHRHGLQPCRHHHLGQYGQKQHGHRLGYGYHLHRAGDALSYTLRT